MSDHVYKQVELTGTSSTTIEDAINGALRKASESLHNLRWFEVREIRGAVENGKAAKWQITLKVGFTLDEGRDD
jgi:dodecin